MSGTPTSPQIVIITAKPPPIAAPAVWFDFHRRVAYDTPTVSVAAPLAGLLPLLQRAGTIVPLWSAVPASTGQVCGRRFLALYIWGQPIFVSPNVSKWILKLSLMRRPLQPTYF